MLDEDRCKQYAIRQKLTEPKEDFGLVQLIEHLCGIQDQVQGSVYLAAKARLKNVTADKIQKDLWERRSLVRTWTVRGTMHVIIASDWPMFRTALRPEWESRWSRYLQKYATWEQRELAAKAVLEVLDNGPATRAEIQKGVEQLLGTKSEWLTNLLSPWGGVLKDLAYWGEIVHGPQKGSEVTFVKTKDWLPQRLPFLPEDPDAALSQLFLRYLMAYGPATIHDFAYWSGVSVVRAKRALQLVKGQLRESDHRYDVAFSMEELENAESAEIAFLPNFDCYLLGHKEKFYLQQQYYKEVYRPAGHIQSVILYKGKVIGVWTRSKNNRRSGIDTKLFSPLDADIQERVLESAERYLAHEH